MNETAIVILLISSALFLGACVVLCLDLLVIRRIKKYRDDIQEIETALDSKVFVNPQGRVVLMNDTDG